MGARWAWFAKCPNGHLYGNFSGGADNCYECGEEPAETVDCCHQMFDVCDCKEWLNRPEPPPRDDSFQKELESLLNRKCMENGAHTPDFILAEYLGACLRAFNVGVNARDRWYGIAPKPGWDRTGGGASPTTLQEEAK